MANLAFADYSRAVRLTTWNCNGGFSRKIQAALSLKSDILIVPECAEATFSQPTLYDESPTSAEWIGNIPNKGLGVFSFGECSLSHASFYDPQYELILPLEVRGPISMILLAVWTLPDSTGSYVRPLIEAWQAYAPFFGEREIVVAGDFNASVIFTGKKGYPFSAFLDLAGASNLTSLYHEVTGDSHGAETSPTFFMYRHEDKPFHIDFIFAGKGLRSRLRSFEVGTHQDWSAHSDHVPLTAEFEDPSPRENV